MNELFAYKYDDGGRGEYFDSVARDCVCRAIAIVTQLDYMDVYELIKENGQHPARGINVWAKRFRRMMERLGFRYGVPFRNNAAHLKNGELPSDKRIICVDNSHAIAVVNGVVRDTFDSRYDNRGKERLIYGYWIYEDKNLLNEGQGRRER